MADAQTTTDHDIIRSWAEDRGGQPATVERTESGDEPGVLTIHFHEVHGAGDDTDEALEDISWDAWFDKFEEENLAFLHQDQTADGETSRFFKLVTRD